jgi:NAD+ synthase
MRFNENILNIKNIQDVEEELQSFIKEQIFDKFRKKGAVIGVSGGIDSALTCALCVKAIGSTNVLGLIMPERDSNSESAVYAKNLCEKLGVKSITVDITHILESFGVYDNRDKIIKKYFPNFNNQSKYRIVVPNRLNNESSRSLPHLEILGVGNQTHKVRLSLHDYLDLTASTNIKHRTRMALLYYHAEKNHFVVAGTTNKSEMVQGYYVKYGDGGVDIEPLAELYKTQVYQISSHLAIPDEIIKRKPSPDTWSFEVSDEDFFYGLPYKTLDLIWFANENSIPPEKISTALSLTLEQVKRIIDDQKKKWRSSQHMRDMPPRAKPNIVLSDS